MWKNFSPFPIRCAAEAKSAIRQSGLVWELTRPSLTQMSQQTSSAGRGDTTDMLNKAEWGQDWSLRDVASSSSLLVPVSCKSSLMSQVPLVVRRENKFMCYTSKTGFVWQHWGTSAGIRSLYSAGEAWQGHCRISCNYLNNINFWGTTGIENNLPWADPLNFYWDVLIQTLQFQRPRLVGGYVAIYSSFFPQTQSPVLLFPNLSYPFHLPLSLLFPALLSPFLPPAFFPQRRQLSFGRPLSEQATRATWGVGLLIAWIL